MVCGLDLCPWREVRENHIEIDRHCSKSPEQLGDNWVRCGQGASPAMKSKPFYVQLPGPLDRLLNVRSSEILSLPWRLHSLEGWCWFLSKVGQESCPGMVGGQLQRQHLPVCLCCPSSPSCKHGQHHLIILSLGYKVHAVRSLGESDPQTRHCHGPGGCGHHRCPCWTWKVTAYSIIPVAPDIR